MTEKKKVAREIALILTEVGVEADVQEETGELLIGSFRFNDQMVNEYLHRYNKQMGNDYLDNLKS